MSSPFPGMDPFLEHPLHFPGLHDRLITAISDALQPQLPDPYYAEISERLWIEIAERPIGPDVHIVRSQEPSRQAESAAVAVANGIRTSPIVITLPLDERREIFLHIRRRGDGDDRVVTSIEILSLSNKTPGDHGRDLYQQKQQETLHSQTHLLEIDLLRGGTHTTAVPLDWLAAKAGPCDYHACVHCFDRPLDYLIYPILITDPLPEIAVPLLPDDGVVSLDLQALFEQCYDRGPYRRKVRYRLEDLVPPLAAEQRSWVTERLSTAFH
jgi:hypothetical protein